MSKVLKNKLIIFSILALMSSASIVNAASAKLVINGKNISCSVPPVEKNNTTLVPFRVIGEALGAKVDWDSSKKQVILTEGNSKIVLTIGSKKAIVNSETKDLSVAPEIINNTVMIPVRFVSENLNSTVNWDKNTNTVHINKDSNTNTENKDSSNSEQIKTYSWGLNEFEGQYGIIINITANGCPSIPGSTLKFKVQDSIYDYKIFESISDNDGILGNKEMWPHMIDEVYGGDGIFGFCGDSVTYKISEDSVDNVTNLHFKHVKMGGAMVTIDPTTGEGISQSLDKDSPVYTVTWNADGSVTVNHGNLIQDNSL